MLVRIRVRLLTFEHCCSISTGSSLTTLLTALISLRATTACLPTWRAGCDLSASTLMRSWWKVSKHGWAHVRQTSLTQAYKNVFPDTCASILAVTTLRTSLSRYVFFVIFFLVVCSVNSSPEVTFRISLVYMSVCVCVYIYILWRICSGHCWAAARWARFSAFAMRLWRCFLRVRAWTVAIKRMRGDVTQ
jgi:hypothetical protein